MKAALITALVSGLMSIAAPSAHAISSEESGFVAKINASRGSRGLRSLTVKGDLVDVARRHSREMADAGTIYHNTSLPNQVRGDWTRLGENVGVGATVDELHQAFMDSAPHRANILEGDYNQVGIGVVITDGTIYVTEIFATRAGATKVVRATKPRVGRRLVPQRRATTTRASAPAAAERTAPDAPAVTPAPQAVDILVRMVDLEG